MPETRQLINLMNCLVPNPINVLIVDDNSFNVLGLKVLLSNSPNLVIDSA
jgi:hypothetical protein